MFISKNPPWQRYMPIDRKPPNHVLICSSLVFRKQNHRFGNIKMTLFHPFLHVNEIFEGHQYLILISRSAMSIAIPKMQTYIPGFKDMELSFCILHTPSLTD